MAAVGAAAVATDFVAGAGGPAGTTAFGATGAFAAGIGIAFGTGIGGGGGGGGGRAIREPDVITIKVDCSNNFFIFILLALKAGFLFCV